MKRFGQSRVGFVSLRDGFIFMWAFAPARRDTLFSHLGWRTKVSKSITRRRRTRRLRCYGVTDILEWTRDRAPALLGN